MTADIATAVARSHGPEMGRAILMLYRSAGEPGAMAESAGGLELASARPGLSLLCTADTFVGSEEIRRSAAKRAGARTEVLEGLDHYWMIQDPNGSAAVLRQFWESVG